MKTLNQCILEAKEKYSKNIFLKTAEKESTYDEVMTEVIKWSQVLKNLKIEKNDRVGIIAPKSTNQIKSFYATWMIGGIALPINEASKEKELKFILEDAEPKIILTVKELSEKISLLYPKAKIVLLEEIVEEAHNINNINYKNNKKENKIDENDTAVLIYTSGSTGNPKGVMLTHKNLLSNGKSLVIDKKLTEKECLYSILPYWHSFSLSVEVVAMINCGGSLGFTDSQRNFIGNIPIFKPTIILVVPRILELLKNNIEKQIKAKGPEAQGGYEKLLQIAPLVIADSINLDKNNENSKKTKTINPEYQAIYNMLDEKLLKPIKMLFGENFREFISGGAALDTELQRYFGYLGIPLMQGYGLSEVSPVVSVDNKENYSFGSVGKLLDWIINDEEGDYTFLDEDGNIGKDLNGELLLKGKCVMKGYWNHKDDSAKIIKDGWLFSGDMGYYKDDKLYLNGRKTNMMVLKGGENVHPEPIENQLKKSEVIEDAMVVGDGYKNVYAVLTIPEHYDEMHETELKTLLKSEVKRLSSKLISYQKPKKFIVVPRFSVEDETYTGTLKIRRHIIIKRDEKRINSFLEKVGER